MSGPNSTCCAAACWPLHEAATPARRDGTIPLHQNGGRTRNARLGSIGTRNIDREMQLAPLPPRSAVLLGIPLALSEQLHPRAVQHQVDRASAGQHTRLASCECLAAAAKLAVVWDGQRQPEQAQHAAAERLGLLQG